mgnify:CR=1 FL=1
MLLAVVLHRPHRASHGCAVHREPSRIGRLPRWRAGAGHTAPSSRPSPPARADGLQGALPQYQDGNQSAAPAKFPGCRAAVVALLQSSPTWKAVAARKGLPALPRSGGFLRYGFSKTLQRLDSILYEITKIRLNSILLLAYLKI